MADRYLAETGGQLTEIEATVTSAGAGNAGDILALDGTGRLDPTVMPVGVSADVATVQASENLAANDFVNIHDVGGAFRARKADASTTGKQADGFVLAAVTSGNPATVYFEGRNTGVSGATPGAVFLSATTAGGFTATAPSAAGQIVQKLGIAVAATEINFEPQQHIVLA